MQLHKTRITKADGRYLWYYSAGARTHDALSDPASLDLVSDGLQIRRDPIRDVSVVVAPQRQDRTHLPPPDFCPLCPTRNAARPTEIPSSDYELVVFENRFPSFQRDAQVSPPGGEFYETSPPAGACEVVVYSPQHDAALAELPRERVEQLIEVWADRFDELSQRPEVAFVYIFENRGREVGVTLTHPHGQIYAFPFVPPAIERELQVAGRHLEEHGSCLHCDIVATELTDGGRVVAENESFLAHVPFAPRFPYEVHIVSKQHYGSLADLSSLEGKHLAGIVRLLLTMYDSLWDAQMPFMMAMHQRPTDSGEYPQCHFHIEFMPVRRGREHLKFLAGCEIGAGTFLSDMLPENAAAELRAASPGSFALS